MVFPFVIQKFEPDAGYAGVRLLKNEDWSTSHGPITQTRVGLRIISVLPVRAARHRSLQRPEGDSSKGEAVVSVHDILRRLHRAQLALALSTLPQCNVACHAGFHFPNFSVPRR